MDKYKINLRDKDQKCPVCGFTVYIRGVERSEKNYKLDLGCTGVGCSFKGVVIRELKRGNISKRGLQWHGEKSVKAETI